MPGQLSLRLYQPRANNADHAPDMRDNISKMFIQKCIKNFYALECQKFYHLALDGLLDT